MLNISIFSYSLVLLRLMYTMFRMCCLVAWVSGRMGNSVRQGGPSISGYDKDR